MSGRVGGAGQAAAVGVVVVAGGSGTRLGADRPKAFVQLAGMSLLEHAVRRVLASGAVGHVVAVVPGDRVDEATTLLAASRVSAPARADVQVVAGGGRRQDSVAAGLAVLPDEVTVVLVHDAARCLAPSSLVVAVIDAVRRGAVAVLPGVPVTDTVKVVSTSAGAETVLHTVDRTCLRSVQTPQGFDRAVLQAAHERAHQGEVALDAVISARFGPLPTAGPAPESFTDDAEMVEQIDEPVVVIPGDPLAVKITTPADLAYAEWLLASSGDEPG